MLSLAEDAALAIAMCSGREHLERGRFALRQLPQSSISRLLDVGCGPGDMCMQAAMRGAKQVVGIDASEEVVAHARGRLAHAPSPEVREAVRFEVMDGRKLAFATGHFDAVMCSRVLVHAPRPASILEELARVLQPGGWALIVEPKRTEHAGVDSELFSSSLGMRNPTVGAHLSGMLGQRGFVHVVEREHHYVDHEPPDVASLREQYRAGHGLFALAVQRSRACASDVETLFAQLDAAKASGSYRRISTHAIVTARRGPAATAHRVPVGGV